MQYTFIAFVENKPGVLNRVASLFRRRNFNIEALAVGRTEEAEISCMNVVLDLSIIIEITGTEDKIEGMLELLRPIGIVEMVRTGQVAMTRGANSGIRRVPGVNGNRYEDVYEIAEMTP